MNTQLSKKVNQAIALLRAIPQDEPVELCYSGGKDSDVVLQLARMAGISFTPIYKNTTIDPPHTIAHVKEAGAQIIYPEKTFFQLVAENGFPSRWQRHCCRFLKEYKVLNRNIQGIRKSESTARDQRYNEPEVCRVYGRGKSKVTVQAYYPILEWTDEDELDFISAEGIKLHPYYYREDGTIDIKRRVGCMCCPLAYYRQRIEYFRRYPSMVRAYIRAGQKFLDSHPLGKQALNYANVYEWFTREVFFEKQNEFVNHRTILQYSNFDYKDFLESFFDLKL